VGALVEIGDPESGDTFKASITSTTNGVVLSIVEKVDTASADVSVTLLCALCKGQKNELICDWATELGCTQIIFWQSDRSIVRLKSEDDATAKAQKFSKAAIAAAQQSRQVRPPKVHVATSLTKALEVARIGDTALKVCCSLEHDAPPLSQIASDLKPGGHVFIVVGPEGDLSPGELDALKNTGFRAASLGRQVLRSELAVVTAIVTVKER